MQRFVLGLVVLIASLPLLATAELSPEEIQKAYWDSYNYEKMQNYEDAIKALMPVYEAYPNGYTVNLRLGWLYYLQGHYANARYHYERAMKVAPASIEAKLGYTLPLLKQQKYREVEQICYQCRSGCPEDAEFVSHRCCVPDRIWLDQAGTGRVAGSTAYFHGCVDVRSPKHNGENAVEGIARTLRRGRVELRHW